MTRFTSNLAIATVAFALVAGFGPSLMQPAFAKGGHEAAQHEINGGNGKGDHTSADKSGGTSSVDKGGDKSGSSVDKNGSSVDKGGDKAGSSADKAETNTETETAETNSGDTAGDK
jgi:hypothetical protein